MTRGTFAIIVSPTEIRSSIEFNGDMYLGSRGNGTTAYKRLKRLKNVKDFEKLVKQFNEDFYGYDDEQYVYVTQGDKEDIAELLNFSKDYFENWFSDYVYLKNMSNEVVYLTTCNFDDENNPIVKPLNPGEIVVLNFGELC